MRNVNVNVLSGVDRLNINGDQIDANQLISASFHVVFGDSTAAGNIKIQGSNDICNDRYQANAFTVTNWVNIPGQSSNVSSGAQALLTITQSAYRWLRAVYTSTGQGVQHIFTVGDVAGSLNNTYFLLNSANSGTEYYVWFDVDGTGVDPALPGKTGVPVAVTMDDDAATVAALVSGEIDALVNFVSTVNDIDVTVTNSSGGPFVAMTDAGDTGFTFTVTSGGTSTININMNALSV